jgi:hypothetical protein
MASLRPKRPSKNSEAPRFSATSHLARFQSDTPDPDMLGRNYFLKRRLDAELCSDTESPTWSLLHQYFHD